MLYMTPDEQYPIPFQKKHKTHCSLFIRKEYLQNRQNARKASKIITNTHPIFTIKPSKNRTATPNSSKNQITPTSPRTAARS
mmetsp:Transcript_20176/g.24942  ORF Transcript_20176/g.24942 Transcript_20176/m.24942 type:complete len:82 (-) Transcript_20176:198-443(-)